MAATFGQAEAALPGAKEIFEGLATVVYIGVTPVREGFGLKVLLLDPPQTGAVVPTAVNGVPLTVKVTGEFVYSRTNPDLAV
jgi:hypothetical protein